MERGHHLLEGALVVRNLVSRREAVVDPPSCQRLLELRADELAEVHRRGAELGADHLEFSGGPSSGVGNARVRKRVEELRVLGDRGDNGHKVRLPGPVVPDDKEPLVVGRLVELDLRDQDRRDLLGHLLAHDIGRHELPGGRLPIGVAELDDCFDRFKLDQIAVFHRVRLRPILESNLKRSPSRPPM